MFKIGERTYGFGAIIALLVLIAVFVLWIVERGTNAQNVMIGALALAYLIG